MSDSLTADILERAADLIEPEGAFDPGPFAMNADGKVVDPDNPDAVCFCASGATWRAALNLGVGDYGNAADDFFKSRFGVWPSSYARHHPQAAVVAAFREAAAIARSTGDQGS